MNQKTADRSVFHFVLHKKKTTVGFNTFNKLDSVMRALTSNSCLNINESFFNELNCVYWTESNAWAV